MGRELRRKEEKKNKIKNKNINTKEVEDTITSKSMLKISILTLLILISLYYIVAIFITKEITFSWTNNNTEEITNKIENKILAKNIFNQKENEYYVYFYDFNNEDSGIANAITNSKLTIYKVDTSSALNSNYVTLDKGNRKVTSIETLKVKNPTLIKIDNDKVVSYNEGRNEIIKALGK